MGDPGVRIEALSVEERLELMERIWESLRRTPSAVPVSEEQKAELDRRAAALDANVARGSLPGVPWDEVLRQLHSSR